MSRLYCRGQGRHPRDDTELYGHGIATIFADTARRLGLNVVGGPEGINRNASDYRALALKIRESGADMVYFGGITANDAGKLWQDLRAVVDVIRRAGAKDRDAVRKAILETRDFNGVLGRWSFDPNGDTTLTTMSVSRIVSSKIAEAEFVGLIEAPR